ncbi:hypothetical protein P3T76_011722 [Phytophthora citrophthora]|uniref:Uncharacterized protein n=1 Tax=Phytophthora citrophthora TaxID=4793 RepID=A0AAD9G8U1_9STRA|nr:hypothetical protein P3T76_011722 [Phytophthora citrophthora]
MVHLNHKWRDDEYAFPPLTKITRSTLKCQRLAQGEANRCGSFTNVGIKWGSPISWDIVAGAAEICRNVLGDEIWFTSHCFRSGGAQYRFVFAPEKHRWSVKLVKWWDGWASSEKAETVTWYLLDNVLEREENQLGDLFAPDASIPASTLARPSKAYKASNLVTLMLQILILRENAMFKIYRLPLSERSRTASSKNYVASKNLHKYHSSSEGNEIILPPRNRPGIPMTIMELPDAKSWRDFVYQYWNANPALHQYRAGVDMFLVSLYSFTTNMAATTTCSFAVRLQGDLAVNRILAEIKKIKNM